MTRALLMMLLVGLAVSLVATLGDADSAPATPPKSAWLRPARRVLDPARRERREAEETRCRAAGTTIASETATGSAEPPAPPAPVAATPPARKRMTYRGLADRVARFATGLDRLTMKLFRVGQGAADTGNEIATAPRASEGGLPAVAVTAPEKPGS